ncbi:MAG: DUF3575 domain-containing protein [Prevotellaceae bacterium]|jgi:hypothetical protein|nr:DUF3575 domain-containing protein [Prevotellaceae bacterium]
MISATFVSPYFENDPLVSVQTDTALLDVALKTNLLFDAAGAPNIGIEKLIFKQFSLFADVAYSYWRINNLFALQTIQTGIGAKYWFDPSECPLTGWNVGIYGLFCGRYDVQWKDGYQGDGFWSGGMSGGYSLPLSKCLNLEFSLAAGYFYTPEVRHYHRPQKGHLLWEETRTHVGRFSLTKMQVNIVWFISKKK